jgi:hypothetical protein
MLVCERYFRIGRWRGIVEKFGGLHGMQILQKRATKNRK